MTDLERFLAFYEGVGIKLNPMPDTENIRYLIGDDHYGYDSDINTSKKFNGYNGFYSDVEFTKDGKFMRQGFWE